MINPNGPLVQAGSNGDNGQTGRKLAMDFYGPRIPIGGGALSGKHLSHIDRIPRHRIVDAHDYDHLGTKVREFLAAEPTSADQEAIHHFLRNEFRVSTDLGTLRTQLKDATYRLSDGLATWVPRISSPSSTFRIQATAGSGKTQLALRLLENASASAQRALYVCFNRPLADHIARIAPTRAQVASFHELCIDHYRQRYQEPDFTVPNIFTEVTNAYLADSESLEGRFDLIIVDEGQDFDPMWVGSLLPQLKPDGRFFLMEDDDQRLYQRDAFDLGDAVTIACRDNYRSPRAVCQGHQRLRAGEQRRGCPQPLHRRAARFPCL
jgi:hypothetical protein